MSDTHLFACRECRVPIVVTSYAPWEELPDACPVCGTIDAPFTHTAQVD